MGPPGPPERDSVLSRGQEVDFSEGALTSTPAKESLMGETLGRFSSERRRFSWEAVMGRFCWETVGGF